MAESKGITQEELRQRFDDFVLLFKKSDSDIEELKWFFDTSTVRDQIQILIVAINLLVGISRKECLIRDNRISLPSTIAREMADALNDAVQNMYDFKSDSPLSDVLEAVLIDPTREMTDKERELVKRDFN